MPALRPLFSRMFPRLFGASFGGASDQQLGSHFGVSPNATIGGTGGKAQKLKDRDGHRLSYLGGRKSNRAEIRDVSPTGSEEQIMTYNGILRTTNVDVSFEDSKRSDAETRD